MSVVRALSIAAIKGPCVGGGVVLAGAVIDDVIGIVLLAVVLAVISASGDGGEVEKIILPIEGYGLWSTLYGFLALAADTTTIKGITYYEHGETPGLGREINNPRWQAQWRDKEIFDDSGAVRIRVTKNATDPDYDIDALSGATLSSRAALETINRSAAAGSRAATGCRPSSARTP